MNNNGNKNNLRRNIPQQNTPHNHPAKRQNAAPSANAGKQANTRIPSQKAPAAKKRVPTARELAAKAEYEAKVREYRKSMFMYYARFALTAVLFALVLAGVLFGIVSCNFFSGLGKGGSENYSYTVELLKTASDEDNEKTVLHNDTVCIDGAVYVPLSELKIYGDYTVAGDSDSISVIFGSTGGAFSDGDCAEFLLGSNCVRVNKNRVTLAEPIVYKNKELYIPYDFIKLYMSGFNCTEEIKGSKQIIKIEPSGEAIGFRLAESSAEYPPIESEYFPDAVPMNEFVLDLSAYEEYMTPADESKYLVLANNKNRLPESYDPGELIDIIYTKNDGREVQKLEKYAAMSLEAMLKEASAEGCKNLAVTTGYRSYAVQKGIYDARYEANKAAHGANAEAETIKAVSYPGASDHQTGLGVDLHNLASADLSFTETSEYKWLIAHCADFGFILRYPEDKESVTGVDFEPWHFRFVGRYNAQNIMRQGLCLEEYVASLSQGEN